MIEILEASHGGATTLHTQLSDYETLDQLITDASVSTSIAPENVLLFMEDGRELKDEVLQEVYERGGEGGQSDAPPQQLFLFNRATFYAESPETWAVQYQEDLALPPLLNLSAISDLGQAQLPFVLASEHLQHLISLFYAQARSLAIAYTSLASHLQPLLREFDEFQERAKDQLDNEDRLIRSSKADMVMLPRIVVHDAFNKKKERRDSSDGGAEAVRTMASYVNPVKMQQVRESCQASHATHIKQFDKLASQVGDLALQSEAERRASEERAQQVADELEEGMQRFQMAISQLEVLFQNDTPSLSQDLMELDAAMREDLTILTNVKNDYTLELHIHLRQVADFQIRIAELVTPIQTLDVDLKSQAAFPHLQRLHLLPFAYAATVIEVVRRKKFALALKAWTDRLSATFATFAEREGARRREIRTEVTSQLPFVVGALDEVPLKLELSVVDGAEPLSGIAITKADIEGLTRWIQTLKDDGELQAAILDEESDPIPFLEHGVSDLIAKMDEASSELDQMIERSVLLHRSRHGDNTQDVRDRLGVLSNENEVLRRQLADRQNDHQTRVRHMEDTHEQRTRSLQTRQAELQDELVRLRTDLEEEMMARQALSTELSERAREQEHQIDQSEVISALQADLSQEKDRTTDLGVRLQEALLDIDGLRSSEASLQSQVQSMQDERSKLLQTVSDAQNGSRQLESQLAGLKAELEATTTQLGQARTERDTALKNQSAEAERLMRDHIAEADGDRAVLEHQNLTLSKQVEDIRIEMEEKITAARNMATRTADGLKAELSFTKAQLRDVQRKETILADELAIAKDAAQAMTQKDAHQADVARDAVALVAKYHDTCQRIISIIHASSTISASTNLTLPKVAAVPLTAVETDGDKDKPMRDSVLGRSLATATNFDLDNFADAVNKTISLVKKLNKSCRHYRDHAKNKISFTAFTKGDLALFLPTRNATTRPWMAYNVSAPHHFLKVPGDKVEAWKARDSIIARIIGTEEAVAGDTPTTNPFGLAEGLRFYIHQVEEFNPAVQARTPRRSASTPFGDRPLDSVMNISEMTPRRPSAATGLISPTETKRYFPITPVPAVLSETPKVLSPAMETKSTIVSPTKASAKPPVELEVRATQTSPVVAAKAIVPPAQADGSPDLVSSPVPVDPAKLSPVFETTTSPPPSAQPAPVILPTRPAPPFAFRPSAPSVPVSTLPLPASTRPASRASGITTLRRDNASAGPSFTPGSLGRAPSVASSGGSYTQPSILTGMSTAKSALAPAMAVTASSEYRRSGSSNDNHSTPGIAQAESSSRRTSTDAGRRYSPTLPPAGMASTSVNRTTSSAALFTFDDLGHRSSPDISSPLSREVSRQPSIPPPSAGPSRPKSKSNTGGTVFPSSRDTPAAGRAGLGLAPGSTPPQSDVGSLGTSAGSRFWTLGRKRLGSMVSPGPAAGDGDRAKASGSGSGSGPATAEALLKRFDQF